MYCHRSLERNVLELTKIRVRSIVLPGVWVQMLLGIKDLVENSETQIWFQIYKSARAEARKVLAKTGQ
jgi:hypothetical protein